MADLLCTLMVLCRGVNDKGKPFWAYMCIKPSMAKAFKEARERGNVDLEDYGTVLETGEGTDVPPDVRGRMERDYGANHDFERMLMEAIYALENRVAV